MCSWEPKQFWLVPPDLLTRPPFLGSALDRFSGPERWRPRYDRMQELPWRGAGVVERGSLENCWRRKALVGSNPTPSARFSGDTAVPLTWIGAPLDAYNSETTGVYEAKAGFESCWARYSNRRASAPRASRTDLWQ
jgi:hypothetical protein